FQSIDSLQVCRLHATPSQESLGSGGSAHADCSESWTILSTVSGGGSVPLKVTLQTRNRPLGNPSLSSTSNGAPCARFLRASVVAASFCRSRIASFCRSRIASNSGFGSAEGLGV